MVNYSVDLFPYYLMILFGIIGLVAVFLYILYYILKFIIKRKNQKNQKLDIRHNNSKEKFETK